MEEYFDKLVEKLTAWNKAYREGKPLASDEEYDELEKELKVKYPNHDWFHKSVHESTPTNRKQKLPIPMYSLEKINSYEEFEKWVKSCGIKDSEFLVITAKYDGASLCVNEVVGSAWTRGDGEYGQFCDDHFSKMKNSYFNSGMSSDLLYSFGEAIFSTEDFLRIKNIAGYKSARNAVAGLLNSPDVSEHLENVTYLRYGCDREDLDKQQQLEILNAAGKVKVDYTTMWVASLSQGKENFIETTNKLFKKLSSKYKCDGLVIEINNAETRQNLGRLANNNPRYAIAYKDPSWAERETTLCTSMDWQVSKDGKLAPVINIEPIELCGATVKRASAYNARYVYNNNIKKGSRLVICRSGDVIPKHLETLTFDHSAPTLPDKCPDCGSPVFFDSKEGVDLVCNNYNCRGRLLSELVYFFSTLNFDEFREPTIKKIFDAGHYYPVNVLNLSLEELQSIDGIGNVAAKVIFRQLEEIQRKGTNFAKILTAYNAFQGVIGEKVCQKILNGLKLFTLEDLRSFNAKLGSEDISIRNNCFAEIADINGIGETFAIAFIEGLDMWDEYPATFSLIPITYYGLEEKTFEGQMTIVFTGFRNPEWEKQLIEKGHKIGSSVSKKTSCVVVKEKGSGSTKEEKAVSLGIPVFSLLEFKEKFIS